ncbi:MAG: prepilin-type N-terminal cleavage/methylation domain-containing protein [Planctomycetaceae bacterium]|nr:prepilin-type N-terminal cleavage/methylation domain-containing protein [Planctomycetaceae bacterium]
MARICSAKLSRLLPNQRFRSGLTLLELMVVLVILAIVATVAVQSLQPQVDSQRFESAARLLEEIKVATLGPAQKFQLDGTPIVSGFVADVGRFPRIETNDEDPEEYLSLSELWSNENQLAIQFPFQFRAGPAQPEDYSTIRLPCGWRGPYLQLPIGTSKLVDPWGRPPETVVDEMGTLERLQITIPLSNNQTEPQVLSANLSGGKVQVTGKVLLDRPESATVRIALLTPDPNSSLTSLVVYDDEDKQPGSFLFSRVPVGFRALVADVNGKRQIKYLQVTPNGPPVIFDFQARASAINE